ncbi:Adenylate and Guanylate cyclase catalytic domain/Domain of unknown function (DUF1935), putative [Angomonas deanei]|uniref:adenylate cyclase n=1 Tax=Angomonas deanei TaxID=59799 RepID=A0A7G2CDJ3_9TRYP|nr:Adenylate and Guanylate cyclase catalytic domain/Domain of unknown function (DUF1935), putative [Angomonas deanei]
MYTFYFLVFSLLLGFSSEVNGDDNNKIYINADADTWKSFSDKYASTCPEGKSPYELYLYGLYLADLEGFLKSSDLTDINSDFMTPSVTFNAQDGHFCSIGLNDPSRIAAETNVLHFAPYLPAVPDELKDHSSLLFTRSPSPLLEARALFDALVQEGFGRITLIVAASNNFGEDVAKALEAVASYHGVSFSVLAVDKTFDKDYFTKASDYTTTNHALLVFLPPDADNEDIIDELVDTEMLLAVPFALYAAVWKEISADQGNMLFSTFLPFTALDQYDKTLAFVKSKIPCWSSEKSKELWKLPTIMAGLFDAYLLKQLLSYAAMDSSSSSPMANFTKYANQYKQLNVDHSIFFGPYMGENTIDVKKCNAAVNNIFITDIRPGVEVNTSPIYRVSPCTDGDNAVTQRKLRILFLDDYLGDDYINGVKQMCEECTVIRGNRTSPTDYGAFSIVLGLSGGERNGSPAVKNAMVIDPVDGAAVRTTHDQVVYLFPTFEQQLTVMLSETKLKSSRIVVGDNSKLLPLITEIYESCRNTPMEDDVVINASDLEENKVVVNGDTNTYLIFLYNVSVEVLNSKCVSMSCYVLFDTAVQTQKGYANDIIIYSVTNTNVYRFKNDPDSFEKQRGQAAGVFLNNIIQNINPQNAKAVKDYIYANRTVVLPGATNTDTSYSFGPYTKQCLTCASTLVNYNSAELFPFKASLDTFSQVPTPRAVEQFVSPSSIPRDQPLPFQKWGAPPTDEPDDAPAAKRDGKNNTTVIVVVVVVVVVVLLVALIVALLCCCGCCDGNARDNRNAPKDPNTPVTLMFTDIESSTALWASVPREMSAAVSTHHRIIRKLIVKYKCYEVKTIGDSFMIACSDAFSALKLAEELQHTFQSTDWGTDAIDETYMQLKRGGGDRGASTAWNGLRVRVGVHTGLCECNFDDVVKGYDYYGTVVNTAARVESLGCGGQVLCTYATRDALKEEEMAQLHFTPLGPQYLRGVTDAVEMYQLDTVDGRQFPELITKPYAPSAAQEVVVNGEVEEQHEDLANILRQAVSDAGKGGDGDAGFRLSTEPAKEILDVYFSPFTTKEKNQILAKTCKQFTMARIHRKHFRSDEEYSAALVDALATRTTGVIEYRRKQEEDVKKTRGAAENELARRLSEKRRSSTSTQADGAARRRSRNPSYSALLMLNDGDVLRLGRNSSAKDINISVFKTESNSSPVNDGLHAPSEVVYLNGRPNFEATYVKPCFEGTENGLFFQLLNENENTSAFYNDTTDLVVRIDVVMSSKSKVTALGNMSLQLSADGKYYEGALIVEPGETELFVKGKMRKYKMSFSAAEA